MKKNTQLGAAMAAGIALGAGGTTVASNSASDEVMVELEMSAEELQAVSGMAIKHYAEYHGWNEGQFQAAVDRYAEYLAAVEATDEADE
jgi:hypothetical protein